MKMQIVAVLMCVTSIACHTLSKGHQVFNDLIAMDLEEKDYVEIMSYLSARFYRNVVENDALGKVLEEHDKEIKVLKEEILNAALTKNYDFAEKLCDLPSYRSCLSGDCCIRMEYEFTNLALGQIAWQSSNAFSDRGQAIKAVDGNRDSDWGHYSCTHTDNKNHDWWKVDLGSEKRVGRVVIFNRGDCCGSNLRNLIITVSSVSNQDGNECGTFPGPASNGQIIEVKCPKPIFGRYVKIYMRSNLPMHICEVEVYTG